MEFHFDELADYGVLTRPMSRRTNSKKNGCVLHVPVVDVFRGNMTCLFLISAIPPAAQGVAPAAEQGLTPTIVAALIGAAMGLLTLIAKDLLLPIWQESRARTRGQNEVMRLYIAPLSIAAEKLVWRFREIFVDSRHQFLKSATMPFVYNEYKRKSTLYRIAVLLGWIRAIQLELNSLPRAGGSITMPVLRATEAIKSALADGPEVEILRLNQLCALWDIPVSENRKKRLATEFEIKLYAFAGNKLRHDSRYLHGLSDSEKKRICQELAGFLCIELSRAPLREAVIDETMERAIERLSYREALIYRDWQDAIGDSMLEKDEDSPRRYKTIGYEKFEEILSGKSLWLEVFRDSIVDIDFDAINPNDFRAKQLRDLAAAVGQLIVDINLSSDKDLIGQNTANAAAELVQAAKNGIS